MRRLLLLVVFFGATTPVLGGGAAPPDLIAAGVTVSGISVGGMSSDQAEAARASFGPVIVIRRDANELRYYVGSQLVRTFPVATGQSIYPTPLGTYSIVDMERNPWWRPPTQDAWARGLKPVPPGPGNPLGTRWMGLSAPGVGIHGTPDAASVGYSASHGCVRMQVPDAEWLYKRVHVGTPVFIIGD